MNKEKNKLKRIIFEIFLIIVLLIIVFFNYYKKNTSLNTTNAIISNTNSNTVLNLNSNNTIENTANSEKQDIVFKPAYYSYNYTITENDGDISFDLQLSMGYDFEKEGIVYAFLDGHESGDLIGTYTIEDDIITCKFTIYENECSGSHNIPLDSDGEVTLQIISDTEIKCIEWTKIPKLEGSNLDFGHDIVFPYFRESLELSDITY